MAAKRGGGLDQLPSRRHKEDVEGVESAGRRAAREHEKQGPAALWRRDESEWHGTVEAGKQAGRHEALLALRSLPVEKARSLPFTTTARARAGGSAVVCITMHRHTITWLAPRAPSFPPLTTRLDEEQCWWCKAPLA